MLHYYRSLARSLRSLAVTPWSEAYSHAVPLADVYVPRTLQRSDSNQFFGDTPPGSEALDLLGATGARVHIYGPPGSGKTALLHWLTLTCAISAGGGRDEALRVQNAWPAGVPLPLLLSVSALAAAMPRTRRAAVSTAQPSTAQDLVARALRPYGHADSAAMVVQRLQEGTCLVLLDGLDEAPPALVAELEALIERYPANRFAAVTRQPEAPQGFDCYRFGPLSTTQLTALVNQWYTALNRSGRWFGAADLDRRIAQIQGWLHYDGRFQALAADPLPIVLCILCDIAEQPLEGARTLVYERLLKLLIHTWPSIRLRSELMLLIAEQHGEADDGAQLEAVLPALATAIRARELGNLPGALPRAETLQILQARLSGTPSLKPARALESLQRSGVLTPIARSFGISLWGFDLYLAARDLAQMPDFVARAYQLRQHPHWREAIALAAQCACPSRPNECAALIELLLAQAGKSSVAARRDLLLAAECLRSCPPLQASDLSARLLADLERLQREASVPTAERIAAGMLLGALSAPPASLMPELTDIPSGTFRFGENGAGFEDEGPARWMDVGSFAIMTHPVTNAQFAQYLQATGVAAPRYWHDPRFNNPRQPVVGVTWHEARAYALWLNAELGLRGQSVPGRTLRLPTEAEWEKAASWDAKNSHKRRYPWGDTWDSERANTSDGRGDWTNAPIGSYPGGVSPYGVHDLVGNVWEWTADEYASYPGAAHPFYEAHSYVLRGSSCMSQPTNTRCTYRGRLRADYWRYHLGFRLVLAQPIKEPER